MLRQILVRADEVLHVLGAVAPGDQLAIHLPAHLQAVDNFNLEGQKKLGRSSMVQPRISVCWGYLLAH